MQHFKSFTIVLVALGSSRVLAQCEDPAALSIGTIGVDQDPTVVAESVAVDQDDNILIAGSVSCCGDIDFDPTNGSDIFDISSNPGGGLFATKLFADGAYGWTHVIHKVAGTAKFDDEGNIFVGGYFTTTTDFDPTSGVDMRSPIDNADAFLSKWNADGTYQWTVTFGGKDYDQVEAIAIDDDGSAFVTGSFRGSVDLNPGGLDIHHSHGGSDAFVIKFTSDGSFAWSHSFGGVSNDSGLAIAVDRSTGAVLVGGIYYVAADFDPSESVDVQVASGQGDLFITKFEADGAYNSTVTLGNSEQEQVTGLAVDDFGNCYATGVFRGTVDFDPGIDEFFQSSLSGSPDAFVLKLGQSGSFQWAHAVGSDWTEEAHDIALDSLGNVAITGAFGVNATVAEVPFADFDSSPDVDNHPHQGSGDIFVTVFDGNSGVYGWTAVAGSSSSRERGRGVAYDSSDNAHVTGDFLGEVDFDPGDGVDSHGEFFDSEENVFLWTLEPPDRLRPVLVHGIGAPGDTRPFSGYVDPRVESTNGKTVDQGIETISLLFSEIVQGPNAESLGAESFEVITTGGEAPIIASVDDSQNPLVHVTLATAPPLREWTTIIAHVEDLCGNQIMTKGNLGPGITEPDRIDFGFLPGDVDQSGRVDPFDLLRFRQIIDQVFAPTLGIAEDYVDINRTGDVTPFDLLMFRQLIAGAIPATESWSGEQSNSPQP